MSRLRRFFQGKFPVHEEKDTVSPLDNQETFMQDIQDTKELYSSLPLNKSGWETRLVTLLPGTLKDPVVCTLRTVSLDSGVDYEALSYVWGDPEFKIRISVNRYDCRVSKNLHTALRYIRDADKPKTVWVDAISIDQTNIIERNHQVRQMATIYHCARSVLIWLGHSDSQTDRFLERIRMRSSGKLQSLDRLDYGVLSSILSRPWFDRIWTKQELAVASQDPWVAIGDNWINWATLRDAVQQAPKEVEYEMQYEKFLGHDRIRKLYSQSTNMPLHYLLYLARDSDASDPRDKVYALLGLSSAPTIENYLPDYSLSIESVCMRTVVQVIRANKSLRPLLRWQSHSRKLPSWCSQLTSKPNIQAPVPLVEPTEPQVYATSGKIGLKGFKFSELERSISLSGIQFDIISKTCNWWDAGGDCYPEDGVPALSKSDIRQYLSASQPFWRIEIANRVVVNGSKVVPEYYPENRLMNRRDSVMQNRCSFTTTTGFWGIGPGLGNYKDVCKLEYEVTRAGDVVVILFGSEVPFVLRPHGEFFEYVGECYVAGIMEGEFMELWEKHKGEPECPEEREFELR